MLDHAFEVSTSILVDQEFDQAFEKGSEETAHSAILLRERESWRYSQKTTGKIFGVIRRGSGCPHGGTVSEMSKK